MKGNLLKKAGAMILAMTMLISAAGCGGGNQGGTNAPEQTDAPGTQAPADGETTGDTTADATTEGGDWTGDVSHIVVTYLTGTSSLPADFQLIQDTVNEMTVPKIGVEVEFKPITVFEAMSQYSMWIGSGEQVDLMQIAFQDLNSYVTQGMIEPINDLVAKNAPYIQKLADEGLPIYDGVDMETKYGVSVMGEQTGSAGGFLMRQEDLDLTGLDIKDGDTVTLEQLGEIFAKIKEAKPDTYPCGVTGKLPAVGYVIPNDPLGTTAASGVLIGSDSTEIVNIYETDAYYEYLTYLRDWYEKGYILKDAATSEISTNEYIQSGTISGYFGEGYKGLEAQLEMSTGIECVSLLINEPYMKAIAGATGAYWTIPVTCSDPDAAMRFVNMLMESADLANIIQYGIEGTHYTVVDEENDVIEIPQDSGYVNGLGLWGDQRFMHAIGWRDKAYIEEWAGKATENKTKGYGFCYDSSAMTNQIIAVQGVINEYTPALETGSAELESTYKEFIDKLKANGIDEIIADKQAQFDAWLETQN